MVSGIEEEEESKVSTTAIVEETLPVRKLEDLISEEYVKVPINLALHHKEKSTFSYGYSSYNRFTTKEYIPRLLWIKKTASTSFIHKHSFLLFSHILGIEKEN